MQLVALVVKYADNIHKGFASSLSVVISGVADVFLFKDMSIDQPFLTGTLIVLASTLVFVVHSVRQQQQPAKSAQTHPPMQTSNISAVYSTSVLDYKPSIVSSTSTPIINRAVGGYSVTNRKPVVAGGNDIYSTPSKKEIQPNLSDHIDEDSEFEILSGADSDDRGNLSRTSSGYNLPYIGVGRAVAVAAAVGSIGPYVLSASHNMMTSTVCRPKSSKSLADEEDDGNLV
jgi:hypothetical protein